jgi:hypothetical protein
MIVEQVGERAVEGGRVLEATLHFESPPRTAVRVWFERPALVPPLDVPADPFLPALLPLAAALGENLAIEAPVSANLFAARERVLAVFLRWYRRCHRPRVRVRSAAAPAALPAPGVGSFFSGGLDSVYTLLKRQAEVTHLVHIHGFEIPLREAALCETVRGHIAATAKAWGKPLLPIATNCSEVVVSELDARLAARGEAWPDFLVHTYFGLLLVALGVALRPTLGRVLIPSTWAYEEPPPLGSHPLLEPGWSTPAQGFEVDGCEADRIDKIRWLRQQYPSALEELRVCVDPLHVPAGHLNCGRCWKCVRTLVELRACGIASPAAFPRGLDLVRLRRKRYAGDRVFWQRALEQARRIGDQELIAALEVVLGERIHLPRLLEPWRKRLIRKPWRRLKRELRR